jgi:hypothetical protein
MREMAFGFRPEWNIHAQAITQNRLALIKNIPHPLKFSTVLGVSPIAPECAGDNFISQIEVRVGYE